MLEKHVGAPIKINYTVDKQSDLDLYSAQDDKRLDDLGLNVPSGWFVVLGLAAL